VDEYKSMNDSSKVEDWEEGVSGCLGVDALCCSLQVVYSGLLCMLRG
jgi:hypothetical protein